MLTKLALYLDMKIDLSRRGELASDERKVIWGEKEKKKKEKTRRVR